jgi:hypothetical protein
MVGAQAHSGYTAPAFLPGYCVSLPHVGEVHLHQSTQITCILGKEGVRSLPPHVRYISRCLRLKDGFAE